MIEQPLWNDDLYYHARLQKSCAPPSVDESIEQARDAACAIETGACRIINIKAGRVDFTGRRSSRRLPVQQDPVWCGDARVRYRRVHNIALSTLENFRLPGDVSASKRYWKDIIEPEVEVSREGLIASSDARAPGHRVREDLIEKLTVKKETIRAAK
jgi:O-succinylbenzoate synthase